MLLKNDVYDAPNKLRFEPWSFKRLNDGMPMGPGIPLANQLKGFGGRIPSNADIAAMNDRDLEHHARTVTELQRELMFPSEDGSDPETLLVAGHLEFVTLTNDGISTKILHRWPDVIGEKMVRQSIGRDGGPAPMLSQQRRRPACQDTIAGSSRPSSGKSQR